MRSSLHTDLTSTTHRSSREFIKEDEAIPSRDLIGRPGAVEAGVRRAVSGADNAPPVRPIGDDTNADRYDPVELIARTSASTWTDRGKSHSAIELASSSWPMISISRR